MQIKVKKSTLQRNLGLISKTVGQKNIIPIVSYILIKSNGDNTVTLASTDLDMGSIVYSDGFTFDEQFATTIEYKKLNDIVSKLPDDEITITLNAKNQTVDIKCKNYKFSLKSLPSEDFPAIQQPEGDAIEIPASLITKGVASTAFSASTENIKPALTGLYLNLAGGNMELVATDSHRLANYSQPVSYSGEDTNFLIPAKTMLELSRLIGVLGADTVKIYRVNRNVVFGFGNQILTSRLIDANYPNYKAVVREDIVSKVQIKRAEFMKEIETVDTMGADTITLDFSQNILNISSQNSDDNASAEAQLEIIYNGEPVSVIFNAKYLREVLKNIDYETLNLDVRSNDMATIIFPENKDEYKYLVMPIKQ